MSVSDDEFWAKGLEDEPCDTCGVKPSKHLGHGSFICRKCYEAWWCSECKFRVHPGEPCLPLEERERLIKESEKILADLGIDD